jgi:hypothetical protein
MSWCDIQWGNVGEWVGGVGTGLAFVATALAVVPELRDRNRAQAVQISAWCSELVQEPFSEVPIAVDNPTGQAVRELRAWLDPKLAPNVPAREFGLYLPVLPPRNRAVVDLRFDHDYSVEPGAQIMPVILLEFTDDRGRRWRRDERKLRRIRRPQVDPSWSRDPRAHTVQLMRLPGFD